MTSDASNVKTSDPKRDGFQVYNYCVSFIDLLGQRNALKGQGLLLTMKTEEEHKHFIDTLRNSIGAIRHLQERAEAMMESAQKERPESPRRQAIPPELHSTWDEMQRTRVTTQRWSDGLMSFTCLGDQEIKCSMNAVFDILGLAGSLCLLGLASKTPIRGAIDIAWGVELHEGELYGAVVARAYELESEAAQYPRIVVSQRTVDFLEAHLKNKETDPFSQNNQALADICLHMLAKDTDGLSFIHYLGEGFKFAVTHNQSEDLYEKAHKFVVEQLTQHQASSNSKLAFRYSHLLGYFEAHP